MFGKVLPYYWYVSNEFISDWLDFEGRVTQKLFDHALCNGLILTKWTSLVVFGIMSMLMFVYE